MVSRIGRQAKGVEGTTTPCVLTYFTHRCCFEQNPAMHPKADSAVAATICVPCVTGPSAGVAERQQEHKIRFMQALLCLQSASPADKIGVCTSRPCAELQATRL